MKRYWCIILVVCMMLMPLIVSAQEKQNQRQVYEKAEEAYQIGQLDQAIDLLEDHLNDFSGNLRQSALRLVSICYLAQDDKESSEKYARLLLSINPYYTSVQDPIRFEDMIALLKSGRSSTVTTASSQAESINEAPVPVTVITREMIDHKQISLFHFERSHARCLYDQSGKDPGDGERSPPEFASH